jgi:glycosyltransferase involved in cell wall biosynthesis
MLDSLDAQTVDTTLLEVVVVDDGSGDSTPDLCRERARRGSLVYRRMAHGGIAQAKNVGVLAARAEVILFLDDDDVAAPDLVERHLAGHERRPEPNVAVLGYTGWHPQLDVTPVMHYVTDVGQLLFAYSSFKDGQLLPYHCFWGGRSSCKRSFLLDHGMFSPEFTTIMEDVELAYRLRDARLEVFYDRFAVSYMARPITYDAFCERCERRGRALARFVSLHPGAEAEELADTRDAASRWREAASELPAQIEEVRSIEDALAAGCAGPDATARLHRLYATTFQAFQLKGIAEFGSIHGGVVADGETPAAGVVAL